MLVWTLVPFYWMLATSLKKDKEIYGFEATLCPRQPTLEQLPGPVRETPFLKYLPQQHDHRARQRRSARCCAASSAAYAIARLSFPGRRPDRARPDRTPTSCRSRCCSSRCSRCMVSVGLIDTLTGLIARPSGLHHPVLHLAPDRLFQVGSDRARGGRAGRWLLAARRPVPDHAADVAAGARGGGVLLVHPVLERVPLRHRVRRPAWMPTITTGLTNFIIEDVFFWGPMMGAAFLSSLPPCCSIWSSSAGSSRASRWAE